MSEAQSRQRLAAILAADVSGYSRLMACDEAGTVTALDAARDVFRRHITTQQGRVIDMAGDSVLAVFETAAGAVNAALAVQDEIARRTAGQADDCRMRFRIGVHLGDVIEKSDGTLYGDGVNTAARIESVAEAGGVSVSEAVECAVRHRVAAQFEDMGEKMLKNLAQPVRVYRMRAAEPTIPSVQAAAAAASDRVDKPAIAVLPFNNMSGDPEQEFFADGITEDIITELSRFHELFVISRNSSFKYKGQPVNVQKFARELGVHYVVEGSVRKAGKRVRITVQLIDADTDRHVWAERYDRDLEDIFEIQDEVTASIVATLPGRIEAASRDRVARKTTDNMAAYECVLSGKVLHHRSNREDNARALKLLERAIELDPSYAHAHAWKACVLGQAWGYHWCEDRAALELVIASVVERAMALDDNDCDVHRVQASICLILDQHDKAMYHLQRALSLNPNYDLVVVQHGEFLTWDGKPEEGIPWILKAMQLNPFHPERFWSHLARAYFVARRYAQALEAIHHVSKPDATQLSLMAGCHARLGEQAKAQALVGELRSRSPDFSINEVRLSLHYRHEADLAHHVDSLALAGLPP